MPPKAVVAEATEQGLALLASVTGKVPGSIEAIMDGAAIEDPMLGMFAAYLLCRKKKPDIACIRSITDQLESKLGDCPDVQALRLRMAIFRGWGLPTKSYAEPPLFRDGLAAFVEASYRNPQIVAPKSLLETACVHRLIESPLSSFPSQSHTLTEERDWLSVTLAELFLSRRTHEAIDIGAIARDLGVPPLAVEARLHHNRDHCMQLLRRVDNPTIATDDQEAHATDQVRSNDGSRTAITGEIVFVPRVVVSRDKIAKIALPHRARWVVEAIGDQNKPVEQVLHDSGFVSTELALNTLRELVLAGIVELVRMPANAT